MNRGKPIIGVTGGIGAGKSTVAQILQELGAAVIDSDRLGHEALANENIVASLRAWWGDDIVDVSGGIDRKALASVVFEDPESLARLEGLVYPWIHAQRRLIVARLNEDANIRVIVFDAPKLYEAGVDRECDAVIFVECDRALRVSRVRRDRGWDETELSRRESRQIPLDVKREKADYIVSNHSSVEALRPELERIMLSVLTRSKRPAAPAP